MRHLILLGAPGAGKGTQAERIRDRYRLDHVSTGDMLRAAVRAGTEVGRLAKSYMDAGKLIPDEVIIGVIRDHIAGREGSGILFDGFPRTVKQAEGLEALLDGAEVVVVSLDVPDAAVIERLSSRRSCRSCGAVFSAFMDDIPADGRCDRCGGEIYQRDDDRPDTIANRLKVFHDQTEPILDFYRKRSLLLSVDGLGSPDEVFQRVQKALD